jgi:hypothetical protein
MQQGITLNTLLYGDNLPILREYIPDESIDLVKIQILTIEELLHGAEIKMPPQYGTFKEAQRVRLQGPEHPQLDLEEFEPPMQQKAPDRRTPP